MSDDPVRTIVQTADGRPRLPALLSWRACGRSATGVRFEGAGRRLALPAFQAAWRREDLAA
jgi:hypothetical protein